ncbi:hypothetical protein JOB18_048258 [Solea senegalensis]|uniref:Uncharacterized protein n=1 Tax=Solea senegalensis TaxID=28829 RepID=A0AAV6SVL0_SOLSE|nr:hypothetical protein JOB18_048258 [Solea senegalensis]
MWRSSLPTVTTVPSDLLLKRARHTPSSPCSTGAGIRMNAGSMHYRPQTRATHTAAGVPLSPGCDVTLPECMASSAAPSCPGQDSNKHRSKLSLNVDVEAKRMLEEELDRGTTGLQRC